MTEAKEDNLYFFFEIPQYLNVEDVENTVRHPDFLKKKKSWNTGKYQITEH